MEVGKADVNSVMFAVSFNWSSTHPRNSIQAKDAGTGDAM